jgi:hypothetical protein
MNRQEILLQARTQCIELFLPLLPAAMKQGADTLFATAYKTTNHSDHRVVLDTYAVLSKHGSYLNEQIENHLKSLLSRSIETAYNPQRPAASRSGSTSSWSLVAPSTVDDEIRLQKFTGLFQTRSDQEIRELNLRIAGLFRQTAVKERENPFRPYLFSRSLSNAAGELDLSADIAATLTEQLASALLEGVADIYKSLNQFFEGMGVPADLSFVIAPSRPQSSKAGQSAARNDAPTAVNKEFSQAADGRPEKHNAPTRKIEGLLQMVRGKAGKMRGATLFPASAAAASDTGSAEQNASGFPLIREDFADAEPGRTHVGWSQDWMAGAPVMGDALQRFLRADTSGSAYPSTVNAAVAGVAEGPLVAPDTAMYAFLRATQATALDEVMGQDGEIRNLILERRSEFAAKVKDEDEMMTIDVVGMIFEFILCDTQVPAEVRAQIGRLQFLLLKAALLDPQLLKQKNHPARQLINRIGTVSLGLTSNDPFSARFIEEIRRIVEVLLADDSDSVVLFSQLLCDFETFVAQDLRFSNANIERAVEAVEEAEKRSLELARSLARLRAVFSVVKIDPYLKKFIEDTWLRVIEKAGQTDAALASRYRKLVPELVWSVLGKESKAGRSRLLAHLPQLLFDLKAGLNSIKAVEKQDFLNWLIKSHMRVLNSPAAVGEHLSLVALRRHFQPFTNEPLPEMTADESAATCDNEFIQDTAHALDVQLDQINTILEFGRDLEDADAEQDATATDGSASSQEESVMNRLRAGVPIEINVDGAPRKATLNWMSKSETNMILSVEENNFPTTISVGLFRKLLENGRARFLEVLPLFERAVTSLLETADQVDEAFA